ncbi:purine nucleoside phosphorylase, putative [Entamoeba invadens IP1]|uniref:purine nucleoside phosphorylase, putative n=1 Tax=Entamoeba invadens IP1 TaxID=370355 RepID=UPI0002C3F0F5|nr:purine nucleoside phosphorylase, putative [Entamoeba invadens IP1]ELP93028.1 purine nucleoside phosphorylase, putative [Entamoeba invadens IP1]|eukprot:XP_004259799.1 purine nucleoside phosphorylase, putative [Entamoeba invadens IP1]
MTKLTEATLPASGKTIYHLGITEEDLSDNIIVVGDPERVPKAADLVFDKSKPIFRHDHRGLTTMTGITQNNVRVSIVTTGMGTGSTEIIINEILALKMIDVEKRVVCDDIKKDVYIIRVGTSGAVQSDTELGTSIITKYAIGLENTGLFYDIPLKDENAECLEKEVDEKINVAIKPERRFKGRLHPYVSVPDSVIVEALLEAAKNENLPNKVGITASAAGFFGCQGRNIFKQNPLTIENLDEVLATVGVGDVKVENFEMEISTIAQVTQNFDHVHAGCICMAIANRRLNTFCDIKKSSIDPTMKVAVEALEILDKKRTN